MNKTLLRFLIIAFMLAGIGIAIFYRDAISAEALEQWVTEFGAAGPIVFMLIYAIATILFLPGSVLTLAGGALFGPVWGTLYNLTGATLGAAISFIIARYLAGNWAEEKSGGRVKQLKQGVEEEGWRFVAFVRLVPLFPFNVLNYALGLTRIKLSHYVITSYICMLPGALAYTYLGYVGREAIGGGEAIIQKSLLAIALLALVSFLPRLIGRLRQGPMVSVENLHDKLTSNEKVLLLDVRSADEFKGEQKHIKQALNIPLEQLPQRMSELSPYLENTIMIVCRTDKRSAKAAVQLSKNGYTDVHVVKGGMTDWLKAAYPVE